MRLVQGLSGVRPKASWIHLAIPLWLQGCYCGSSQNQEEKVNPSSMSFLVVNCLSTPPKIPPEDSTYILLAEMCHHGLP